MFKKLKIIDDSNKLIRTKSKDVTFPLDQETIDTIDHVIKHLTYSQIPKYEEKYKLRPGMGLSFIQLGIPKNIVIVVYEIDDGVFDEYLIINPKMISNSSEKIAASAGEGCLSVNREIDGHVPRYARVKLEGYDIDGNKIRIRAREELAIAFQHELDHLEGKLFYDRINKDKPFYSEDEIRLI